MKPMFEKDVEMLKLTADGMTARQISLEIFISKRTVEYRLRDLRASNNCKSTTQLIALALRKKWIK